MLPNQIKAEAADYVRCRGDESNMSWNERKRVAIKDSPTLLWFKMGEIIGKVVLLNFYQAVIRKLFLYSVLDDIILEVSSQRVALK